LGPSNLDFAVAMVALSRMGFGVFFLSTRLATEAYVALLEKTDCTRIVTTAQFAGAVSDIRKFRPVLDSFPLIPASTYVRGSSSPSSPYPGRFQRETELADEAGCISFIIHSSGSTGLPKPIFQTHRASLGNYATGSGLRTFAPLPLFHNSGLSTLFRGIVAEKRIAVFNAAMPLTNANLVRSLNTVSPECFQCVPYTLKILAETEAGIEALKRCQIVIFGGSPCPDELGNLLVSRGVPLVGHYGQTEMGQLMMSKRGPDDPTWNYLRPLPSVKDFLHFEPVGDGTYESVVLDGLPTKVISNSDYPPNSYYTRDCFLPHPTREGLWKYIGRLDDRLTLVNGEKVLPVPMEGRIRQSELVKECLVFGAGRALPGLLVIPNEEYVAAGMSKTEFLDKLEPVLKEANEHAEKFGQLAREMVEVLDVGTKYPATDKGTMIRAATYKAFAEVIEGVYARFENPEVDGDENEAAARRVKLESPEALEAWLLQLFRERLDVEGLGPETDFFGAGIDSLQAILARGHMMRELDLGGGGKKLAHNVVYENPSVRQLARHLYAVAHDGEATTTASAESETDVMQTLVEKYGVFRPFEGGQATPDGAVVLLTGTTGSLGAHVLAQLLPLPHIRQVYCLVRAADAAAATARVLTSLHDRGLIASALSPSSFRKIVALPSDLGRADLGLNRADLLALQATVTSVIHSAWAVNFNMTVRSFEAQHIRGVRNLLDLCLSVPFPQPAKFAFISSVSAAAGIPPPVCVPEDYVSDPHHAQAMGYARSKWVAEHLVRRCREQTGLGGRVLRTGQIVGDSVRGHWNATEAIPLQIRSAVTLGALPRLEETPAWLPVDVCAEAVVQLAGDDVPVSEAAAADGGGGGIGVYHVENPRKFSWNEELLPALAAAGLAFEAVGQREWVWRLREGDADPKTNPTVKLLDFFTGKYDNDRPGRKGLSFDTTETQKASEAIARKVDVIAEGTVAKCVARWREMW
jgi:thioester reductase-like protein